ncbi:MAG TPA: hypothetical protein VFB84_12820 [Micromonosporaceae bacterium]|nr:hypothetical protein [Micromonosporaceae bacterium]
MPFLPLSGGAHAPTVTPTPAPHRLPSWTPTRQATRPVRRSSSAPRANLNESTRYVVALRNLRTATGAAIGTEPTFAALMSPTPPADPALTRRWQYAQRALSALATAGVSTAGLHVAWDFTVASQRGLTERILHMRNEAFGNLSIFAPFYTVDSVTSYPTRSPSRAGRGGQRHAGPTAGQPPQHRRF